MVGPKAGHLGVGCGQLGGDPGEIPAVLTVGLLLVAGGIGLRGAMRYQGRHAAPPLWLTRLGDLWPSSPQDGGDRPQLGRHDPVPSQQQRAG